MCVKINWCPPCILRHLVAVVQIVAHSLPRKPTFTQYNYLLKEKFMPSILTHGIKGTYLSFVFICQLWVRGISSNANSQQAMDNDVWIPMKEIDSYFTWILWLVWSFSLLGIALVLETWTKEKCYTLIICYYLPFINWPSGSRKVKSMRCLQIYGQKKNLHHTATKYNDSILHACAIYIIHKCSMWFSFDEERRSPSTVSSYMTLSDLDFDQLKFFLLVEIYAVYANFTYM